MDNVGLLGRLTHMERPADFEQRPLAWRYAWITVNEPPGTESVAATDVAREFLRLFEQVEAARQLAVEYTAKYHETKEQIESLKREVDGMARAPYGEYQKMRERAERAEEQLDSLRATVQKELDFMDAFPDVEDGSPIALVIETLRLTLASNPASEPKGEA